MAWADDWGGANRDEAPSTIRPEALTMASNLRRFEQAGQPVRESDSAVAQFLWPVAEPLVPMTFSLAYQLPASMNRLRGYTPHMAKRGFYATSPVDVELRVVPITESVCMANTAVDGCRMTRYACAAGELVCEVSSADDCAGVGCYDEDGDGYFGFSSLCGEGTDCNDSDNSVNPDAIETCDGIDRNCDGYVDAIGPWSLNETCPDGAEICGPSVCAYRTSCVCPADDAACYCSGTLQEVKQADWVRP
jgi:hypothetical protein